MKIEFFNPTVSVVCRWFQVGIGQNHRGPKEFDPQDFDARLVAPLRRFMRAAGSEVKNIIIVSNADPRFSLGEHVDADGKTPTIRAIEYTFPQEIKNGFIRTIIDRNWGNNAGSSHALNIGWQLALELGKVSHILSWNPELQMTEGVLARMFAHLERHNLDFVGAYRQGYWRLYQWQLAQNTTCLYPIETLQQAGGFSPENCDGNDGTLIEVPGFGRVTLAGMDDFDLALRLAKIRGRIPRWGMIGRADPFLWDVDYMPNSKRAYLFREKVARQPVVIQKWVERHFPDVPFHDFMDCFFANRHED